MSSKKTGKTSLAVTSADDIYAFMKETNVLISKIEEKVNTYSNKKEWLGKIEFVNSKEGHMKKVPLPSFAADIVKIEQEIDKDGKAGGRKMTCSITTENEIYHAICDTRESTQKFGYIKKKHFTDGNIELSDGICEYGSCGILSTEVEEGIKIYHSDDCDSEKGFDLFKPGDFAICKEKKKHPEIVRVAYGWTFGLFEWVKTEIAKDLFKKKDEDYGISPEIENWFQIFLNMNRIKGDVTRNGPLFFSRDKNTNVLKENLTNALLFLKLEYFPPDPNAKEEYKRNGSQTKFKIPNPDKNIGGDINVPFEKMVKISKEKNINARFINIKVPYVKYSSSNLADVKVNFSSTSVVFNSTEEKKEYDMASAQAESMNDEETDPFLKNILLQNEDDNGYEEKVSPPETDKDFKKTMSKSDLLDLKVSSKKRAPVVVESEEVSKEDLDDEP